jgi:hypothetical protein
MSQSLQSTGRLAPSKAAGLEASRRAVGDLDNVALVPDRGAPHHDAVALRAVSPRATLPTVGLPVIERGTEIEIKSCLRDHRTQRGRFSFRQEQHAVLVEDASVYLLLVTEETGAGRKVLARKVVPARTVDDVLSSSWVDPGPGRDDHYQRRSWARFFEPGEVER